MKINKIAKHLVIVSSGPEKLGPGRKMPAATSLVVSWPNFSANTLTRLFGYWLCNSNAVDRPTMPAPIIAKLMALCVDLCVRLFEGVLTVFYCCSSTIDKGYSITISRSKWIFLACQFGI